MSRIGSFLVLGLGLTALALNGNAAKAGTPVHLQAPPVARFVDEPVMGYLAADAPNQNPNANSRRHERHELIHEQRTERKNLRHNERNERKTLRKSGAGKPALRTLKRHQRVERHELRQGQRNARHTFRKTHRHA